MPVAAAVPIILLAVAYVVWIIRDIQRSEVKHLPKPAWIVISIISIPLGGIVYLLVGKDQG